MEVITRIKLKKREKKLNKISFEINYKKVIENIKMWNNISRIINNWLKSLNDKFNGLLSSIGNYCLLQQKIVNFIK